MAFDLEQGRQILARTPRVLRAYLGGLSVDWTDTRESDGSWSPFDVVGHLIHGEKTDWIPRAKIILEHGESKPFVPFDRFAQEKESEGKGLGELLDEFEALRLRNLETLDALELTGEDLDKRGTHPELGAVTLRELLATWVVHDLTHLAQISRVMARRYSTDVGPWARPGFFNLLADE